MVLSKLFKELIPHDIKQSNPYGNVMRKVFFVFLSSLLCCWQFCLFQPEALFIDCAHQKDKYEKK